MAKRSDGGYDNSTPGVQVKVTPENVARLRDKLSQEHNHDLYEAGIKGIDFAEALGNIAAALNISVDGYVDVNHFCGVLCEAIDNRNIPGMEKNPHLQASGLTNVELVERADGTVTLEEVGEAIGTTGASERGTGPYTVCDSCSDSFVCCVSRSCKLGKPATQLEQTMKVLKEIGIIKH